MARARPTEIAEELSDIWRLIVGYAKQETIAPLRGIAAFIRNGLLGMICFTLGAGFAALAIIRAMQTEADTTFDGNWSFVPYVASLVGCCIVLGLAIRSVARTPWDKKGKGE